VNENEAAICNFQWQPAPPGRRGNLGLKNHDQPYLMSIVPDVFKRISLTTWIALAIVAGVLVGGLWPKQARELQLVSNIFLRLVKCVVAPLIFATLVSGIGGHAKDLKAVGRLALKSLVYFEVVTTAALFIGLAVVNYFQPGAGIHLAAASKAGEPPSAPLTLWETVEHAAPQSFFDAAARNDILQVVVFAVLFAVALTQLEERPRHVMLEFCDALAGVMLKFTGLVMWFAPLGVGAAVASTIAGNGFAVLLNLGKLTLTLYIALLLFVLVVFIPMLLLARIPAFAFFKAIRRPALLAFSTASSEAALPDALRLMEEFGVPKRIVSFVLATGYSFNLDGTAVYLPVAVMFVAQAAGVHQSFAEQLPILLTLMLVSKGATGVPRAAIVILTGTLAAFGLPAEGVAVILGVDAFLDLGRSALNLAGNCLAAAVIARWEGELNHPGAAVQTNS
jgi:proton glutamate symport protein